jgi:hypothetical protein
MESLRRKEPGSFIYWLVGCAGLTICLATCVLMALICLAAVFVAFVQVVNVTLEQVATKIEQTLPPFVAIADFERNLYEGNTLAI